MHLLTRKFNLQKVKGTILIGHIKQIDSILTVGFIFEEIKHTAENRFIYNAYTHMYISLRAAI